jgi:soluble lytic murein transglycosylase-like protein
MQLIPETAERFGVRDTWDPEQNLRGGMAYLRWLLDHFEGDLTARPRRVQRRRGGRAALPGRAALRGDARLCSASDRVC